MKPPRSLSDTWVVWLKEHTNRYIPNDDLDALLDALLVRSIRVVVEDDGRNQFRGKAENEVIALARERYEKRLFDAYENLSSGFKRLNNERCDLRDKRRQENWATTWDHAKTFFFRTITTVMIAGVVLFTGYLAQRWQIPLPMLRGLAT